MFCSMCLDGNDKIKNALRGLNLWVLNFIYFNRVQSCEKNLLWLSAELNCREKLCKMFRFSKFINWIRKLFPMLGAIGESWSNLIISVLHKNKFRSSHTSNLRD